MPDLFTCAVLGCAPAPLLLLLQQDSMTAVADPSGCRHMSPTSSIRCCLKMTFCPSGCRHMSSTLLAYAAATSHVLLLLLLLLLPPLQDGVTALIPSGCRHMSPISLAYAAAAPAAVYVGWHYGSCRPKRLPSHVANITRIRCCYE